MTSRTAETSPLIDATVAGLRAPQMIKTTDRYVTQFVFIRKGAD
jgi:hypothetical protein